MKKSILLLLTLALSVTTYCQAPQKFSFQAVARNDASELIGSSSLDIRLSLYAKSDASLVWQETHTVSTSDLGLFTADIGTGTRTGGSASTFGEVDWAGETYSLKVELKEGAVWEDMGSSDLLSVPYALNATSVSNLKSLELVEADDNPLDSALFEVRNNTGNTVFAVYNEGVRIFVDDTQGKSKGSKGGFAIGGFDETKGLTYEFFRVTPDSVRIYLDEGATKGTKGGFAIGGFDRSKGMTEEIMHMSEDNYFIGYESGKNITTGLYNSFFGYQAGVMNTEGSGNILLGNTTGYTNTKGSWNILLGNGVGYKNTIGNGNIMMGDEAGYNNTEGSWNVFIGDWAGRSNISGGSNVYIGADAGISSTIAAYNVFLGSSAGKNNINGSSNVFVGETSGFSNSLGESNVFIGTESGYDNLSGNFNVFLGESSGHSNTIGVDNVFIGASAGELNTEGGYNVFMGTSTGAGNTLGIGNVFIGQEAGYLNTQGSLNVAIGPLAGFSNATGISNVFIGFEAGYYETGSNRLYIDNNSDTTNTALIYGEFDNDFLSFNATVDVWEDLWVNREVYILHNEAVGKGAKILSETLDKLKLINPIEFEVQKGKGEDVLSDEEYQIALLPEELETLFPYLVKANVKGGKGINYSKLSVVLLQAIKEQQDIIDQQTERMNALESKLDLLINK